MHGRTTPDTQVDIFDIGDIASAVWQRRYRVLLALVGGLALGALLSLSIPDQYESKALIEIEDPPLPISSNPLFAAFGGQTSAAAQIAIIESNSIKEKAIEHAQFNIQVYSTRLQHLKNLYNNLSNEESLNTSQATNIRYPIKIDEFVVPDHWQNEAITVRVLDSARFVATLPDGNVVESEFGQRILLGDRLALTLINESGLPGDEYSLKIKSPPEAMESFSENLSVQEVGKSGLLSMSFLASSPDQAVTPLKALLDEFISSDTSHAVQTAQKRLDYIENEIPATVRLIEDAEDALNRFQKDSQTVNIEFETETLLRQVTQIELLLREDQIPKERERLESIRDELFGRLSAVPDSQQHVLNLTRDIEIAQTIYLELMKRVQELRVARASAGGKIRIIDQPYAYAKPVGPHRLRLTILIALIAVALYVIIIFIGSLKTSSRTLAS